MTTTNPNGVQNASSSMALGGRGSLNTDPTRNFRFLVTFRPYDDTNTIRNINFGFTSVSGMSMSVESIPYREGGMNTTLHQIPGQATFSPLTLTRGVHLGNKQAWLWIKQLFAAIGPSSGIAPTFNFRAAVDVHVLQHPISSVGDVAADYNNDSQFSKNDPVAMSFRFYNAWISSVAYSDLNAGDNAIAVEQMTLVHEGMEMFWGETIGGTGPTGVTFPL